MELIYFINFYYRKKYRKKLAPLIGANSIHHNMFIVKIILRF